ncbi:unnamed protein product [Symbiodinium microadriaticum]|nr:unnamed protein product [Symbiodinium microadriaticum]
MKRESAKKESTYTRQIETMTAEAVQATAKISRYEVDIQDKAATIELLESLLHTAETKNNFLEGQIVKLESRKGQDVCTQTLNSGTEARPPATRGPCPVFVIDDNPLSSTFLTPSVEEDVETRHIHSSHADPPQKEVQGLGSSSFSSFPEYVALKRDQPDIVTCTKNGNGSGYRRKGLAAGAASKPPKRAPAR